MLRVGEGLNVHVNLHLMHMLRHVTGLGGVNFMSWVSPCWHQKCRMGTEVETYIKQMLVYM